MNKFPLRSQDDELEAVNADITLQDKILKDSQVDSLISRSTIRILGLFLKILSQMAPMLDNSVACTTNKLSACSKKSCGCHRRKEN